MIFFSLPPPSPFNRFNSFLFYVEQVEDRSKTSVDLLFSLRSLLSHSLHGFPFPLFSSLSLSPTSISFYFSFQQIQQFSLPSLFPSTLSPVSLAFLFSFQYISVSFSSLSISLHSFSYINCLSPLLSIHSTPFSSLSFSLHPFSHMDSLSLLSIYFRPFSSLSLSLYLFFYIDSPSLLSRSS